MCYKNKNLIAHLYYMDKKIENSLQQLKLDLQDLRNRLRELVEQEMKEGINKDALYNNKEIKLLLGVNEKVIKRYRDNGLISFHRINDKYWYLGKDIMEFLKRIRYEAF